MLNQTLKTVTIKVFGQLADITGRAEWQLQADDTDDLQTQMQTLYPALRTKNYLIAVNKTLISENTILNNEDTVALLPPFAGG